MPIFKDTLLTERGLEMANKAANGQGSFTITKAVSSNNAYSGKTDNELRQLTKLDNETGGRIYEQNNVNSKITAIKTNYSNDLIQGGYTVNTAGLYARDEKTGEEFLYSVTPSTVGQVIPEQSDNIFSGFELTIYVIVGNVQQMKVELTPGGDASVEFVRGLVSTTKDNIMEELEKLSNSVKTDLSPELAKKLNTSDYKTDFDKINNTLKSKANNDDLQKAASDINLRVNDRELIEDHKKDIESITGSMFKFQGNWDGNVNDLANQPDGIYGLMNNTKGTPGWFSGFGIVVKYHNSTDLFMNIFDNVGHSGSFSKFGNWVQNANGNDLVNLQNTVNGVLARQSNLNNLMFNNLIPDLTTSYNSSNNVITVTSGTISGSYSSNAHYASTILYAYAKSIGKNNISGSLINSSSYPGLNGLWISNSKNAAVFNFDISIGANTINVAGLKIQLTFK